MFVIPLMPTKHLVLLCPLHLASLGLIKGLAAVWHLDFKPYVGIHDTACYLTCLYIVGCTGLPDRTNTCKPYASARHECNPKKPNCKLCRLSNFPDTTNCNMFTTVHTADWTHCLQVWSHSTTAGMLLTHSCQYVNKASAQCHETGSKTQDHYSNGIAVASLPQHIASSFWPLHMR